MRRTGFQRKLPQRQAGRQWEGDAPSAAPRRAVIKASQVGVSAFLSVPKSPRFASRVLLDLARGQPCLLRTPLCNNNPETTVACHAAGVARGKGMGYKVGDQWVVWGCSSCNHYTDAFGGATAEEKAFAFEAGHARQIGWWRAALDGNRLSRAQAAAVRTALELLGAVGAAAEPRFERRSAPT